MTGTWESPGGLEVYPLLGIMELVALGTLEATKFRLNFTDEETEAEGSNLPEGMQLSVFSDPKCPLCLTAFYATNDKGWIGTWMSKTEGISSQIPVDGRVL